MSDSNAVLNKILSWSLERPMWQRDALRRIVLYGYPDEKSLHEILKLCKKEHKDKTVTLEAIPISEEHIPADPDVAQSVSLISIANIIGVNQLEKNQVLEFQATGLTIVYGRNGTGKSGYTRILKKACRSRGTENIISNIYSPESSISATADLSIRYTNGTIKTINWKNESDPPKDLSSVTVFDRVAASNHIKKENEVFFRPFGLDIPDDLASICLHIKSFLSAEQQSLETRRDPAFTDPPWSNQSRLGKALSDLRHNTDITEIASSISFSQDDKARLQYLETDLAQNPEVAIQSQNNYASQLERLVSYLDKIENLIKNESLQKFTKLKQCYDTDRASADMAARNAFSGLTLEKVGEDVWQALWESARNYSRIAQNNGVRFPPAAGDSCVLCHQTINNQTSKRMSDFEEFIKGDTKVKAERSKQRLDEAKQKLRNTDVHIRKVRGEYRELKNKNPGLAKRVFRYIVIAKIIKCQILAKIEGENMKRFFTPLDPVSEEVRREISKTRKYAISLNSKEYQEKRSSLINELAELKDHKRSKEFLKIARREIVRLRMRKRIDDCLGDTNTRAITVLSTEIADDLITPHMHNQFQKEISKLAKNRVPVKVIRSRGKLGTSHYQVKLEADSDAAVTNVLSEGEQTCVALASYLTELSNATHKSTLIFDDPVSSLDHQWRLNVAKRLSHEASERQVIVFTHDMVFVNDLYQIEEENNRSVKLLNLTRSQDIIGMVNQGLPWGAVNIKARIDLLEKDARKLKNIEDDEDYKTAVAPIYSRLRETWERVLEDTVFAQVVTRYRDYINPKKLIAVTTLNENDVNLFQKNYKKCCDNLEGHDSSRGRDQEPPSPNEVLEDIEALKCWSKSLRKRMSDILSK